MVHKCLLGHLEAGVDLEALERISRINKNLHAVLPKAKPQRYIYAEPKKKTPYELIVEEQDRAAGIKREAAESKAYWDKVRLETSMTPSNVIPLSIAQTQPPR